MSIIFLSYLIVILSSHNVVQGTNDDTSKYRAYKTNTEKAKLDETVVDENILKTITDASKIGNDFTLLRVPDEVESKKWSLLIRCPETATVLNTTIFDTENNNTQDIYFKTIFERNDVIAFYMTESFDIPNTSDQLVITEFKEQKAESKSKFKESIIRNHAIIAPDSDKFQVLRPVVHIEKKKDIVLIENGEARQLICRVYAFYKPDIVWKNLETELYPTGEISFEKPNKYTNTLTIEKVNENATYACEANNRYGLDDDTVTVERVSDAHFDDPEELTKSLRLEKGTKAKLTCLVAAYPPPTITWSKDGNEIKSNENIIFSNDKSIVTIKKVTSLDEGKYVCDVENKNKKIQLTIDVTVLVPPLFDKKNTKVTVNKGDPADIYCKLLEGNTVEIRWFKTGEFSNLEIPQLKNKESLHIDSAEKSVTYICKAWNGIGDFDMITVDLEVQYKPKISDDFMKIVKSTPNSVISLNCNADGGPRPHVTWHRDKTEVSNNATLTIKVEDTSAAGAYTCNATNKFGTDTNTVNVEVNYKPKILNLNSGTIPIEAGKEKSINCFAEGSPTPSVTWHRNYLEITNSDQIRISGAQNNVALTIHPQSISDGGTYICKAKNKFGIVKTIVTVEVQFPATIIPTKETRRDVFVGEMLNLPCQTTGSPKPDIKWMYLRFGKKPRKIQNSSTGDGSLLLKQVNRNQGGNYTCIASNAVNSVNITYEVTVFEKPNFPRNAKSEPIVAVEGDKVLRIFCDASGNPKPKITWTINNALITKGLKYDYEDSTLIIKNVESSENGKNYTCKAENEKGSAEENYTILVEKYPRRSPPTYTVYVKENSTKAIYCNIPHSHDDQLRWYKDEALVHTGELTLISASKLNNGYYTCRVSTFKESKSAYLTVEVGRGPIFTSVEEETVKMTNSPYMLVCRTDIMPPPRVTWYKNNIKMKDTTSDLYLPDPNISLGSYRCEVSNKFETITRNFEVLKN